MPLNELEQSVAGVLEEFSLDKLAGKRGWQRQLKELRQILAADYVAAVERLLASAEPPLQALVERARVEFPDFNRRPLHFGQDILEAVAAGGVLLRMEARSSSPGLRGFYYRATGSRPLIWLNLAHPEGAIAASLGHELGHWYREQLLSTPPPPHKRAFFNANFTDHLTSTEELFADVFPVLAAYPHPLAKVLFPRQRGWRAGAQHMLHLDRATLGRLRGHLTTHYGFDTSQTGQPVPRRVYYVASMLHYARLRRALLYVASL